METTNQSAGDPRSKLQALGAQITAMRKQLAELEAEFDATLAMASGKPTARAAEASVSVQTGGSAATRVGAWLRGHPGKPIAAADVVGAFKDLQPQSVRDALRRLTLDPKSGVTKPTRGAYMWSGVSVGPAAPKPPKKGFAGKSHTRGDLAGLVRDVLLENPKGLPASEVAAAVISRSVRRITNKDVNDQLSRLSKTPGELGIDATGEPRKKIYTPRVKPATSPTQATVGASALAPQTSSSEASA